MSNIILSLLACLLPTAVYVGAIYWVDRYEKEPSWLLGAAFLWGAGPSIVLAIALSLLLDLPLGLLVGDAWSELAGSAIIAPLVEESVKGLALLGILLIWRREIDTVLDGIIYGAMVGMGFAMVENFFYFTREFETGGLSAWGVNVFFRAFVFGLNHALFSSMVGLGVALAALRRSGSALGRLGLGSLLPIAGGWAIAVALHGLHNLGVGLGGSLVLIVIAIDWAGVWITLGVMGWSVLQERRWLREQLREEVGLGVLTTQQYDIAVSQRARSAYLWDVLTQSGLRRFRQTRNYLRLSSKLAYHKQRGDHPQEVETLRARLLGWQL